MENNFIRCYRGLTGKFFIYLCLSFLFSAKAFAIDEPYLNELKGTQVIAGNFVTVSDEKFNNSATWSLIQQNISVNDIVSFEINFDTAIYFYSTPFNCSINFKIYIYGNQSDTSQITDSVTHANINLNVVYDTVTGKPYKGVALYKFMGAYKYKVKILSISCPQLNPIKPIFRLKTQIIVNRQYIFNDQSTDVTRYSVINGNQLKIDWTPLYYPGAETFDLEYTHIDDSSLIGKQIKNFESPANSGNYYIPPDTLAKWFKNNSTRITTASNSYLLNVPFPSGFILFRIRGTQIHYPDNIRWEGNWNYSATISNCTSSCPSGVAHFNWHEENLNWQYSVSFAEEGKHKEVISYFDGSLRNRQSVTLSNTDNKNIVQETIYDALGRPTVSILPAPTNDSTIHYFRGFNKNKNGNPYSFTDLLYNCSTSADSLSNSSGTGKYYSLNNPFLNFFNYAKYIPDAGGYPFATTEYMADNTGRIKSQGGVGPAFQLDSGHATKYFYGKPTQTELDRLFGLEAGNSSHYLKNMVMDPNKQISVSYVDASGKTIATALAGAVPNNLHALPSNAGASVQVTNDLIQPRDFVPNSGEYSLAASSTFLAPITGTYVLDYRVDPLRYEKLFGPDKDSVICSNCYYDLEITVKDDCANLLKRDTIAAGNVFDTNCTYPDTLKGTMNVSINKIGEYYVTYKLTVSKDAMDFYDSVHIVKNSDIKKLNYFLLNELKETGFYGCYSNCETCFEKLGQKSDFVNLFKSLYVNDSLSFGIEDSLWTLSLYDSLYANCQAIQSECVPKNICDEKLQLLKMDVSPGGQYALYDSAYHLLETTINVLARRNEISWFSDDFGNRDSVTLADQDGEDSIRLDVKDLNDSLFIANWKTSWADSLVRLHPEYCQYLWCVANSNSFSFDKEIKDWDDADTAMAKGWFNPNVYDTILAHDPFFLPGGNGFPFVSRMRDSLRLFSRTLLRTSQGDKNILQFIDIVLYCRQSNSWDACIPDSACRSRNREWDLYRNFYLNLKQRFYEAAKRASSDPVFANCVNCSIGNDLLGEIGATCNPPPVSDFALTTTNNQNYSIQYKKIAGVKSTAFVGVEYRNNCTLPGCEGSYTLDTLYRKIRRGNSSATFLLTSEQSNPRIVITTCDTSSSPSYTPFNDSLCNYSCPGGIYTTYDRNGLSLYVEYGTPKTQPTGTPSGYGNCRFYTVFDLKTGANSSCKFFNVWVCEYDSSANTNFSCPSANYFNAYPTTPFCNGYFLAAVYNNGPAIPAGVTVYVPAVLKRIIGTDTTSFNFTAQFTQGVVYYTTCSPFLAESGGNFSYSIGTPYCSGIDTTDSGFTGNYSSWCPPTSSTDSLYANKIRRYLEYVNPDAFINNILSSNSNQLADDADQTVMDECHSNCEAEADLWIKVLRRCTPDSAKLEQLKNALIDICSKGCSASIPFGTSSIPLSITATYHSFEEAIAGILGPDAPNDSCTQELLSNPYPYNKQPIYTERTILETDYNICRKLAIYKTAWQQSGFTGSLHSYLQQTLGASYTLDSLELADMLNSCTNCNGILKNEINLPAPLDPNSSPCLTCDSIHNALTAFHNKYPNLDSTGVDYETLLTNFLNHRFGYSLGYFEYKDFLDSCNAGNTNKLLCNRPMEVEDTTDKDDCVKELFSTALTNAYNSYLVYIDSVHRDFRDAWMTKCMNVQPFVKMTANLYEYHYTLYYYDQSGNLVKTVPPEGVQLLSNSEIVQLQTVRNSGNQTCSNNNSMVFTNGSVNFPGGTTNAPQLNIGGGVVTIETWIYLNSYADQGILSNNHPTDPVTNIGYSLEIKNNQLDILFSNGGVFGKLEGKSPDLSAFLALNKWTHIAVQRTGNKLVKMFINGNEIPVTITTTLLVDAGINTNHTYTDPFYVGASNRGGSVTTLSAGRLRHTRIYTRALLPAEIRQNYMNFCGNPANEEALVFWEPFNEGIFTASGGNNYVYDRIFNAAGQKSGTIAFETTGNNTLVPLHRLVTTYQYNSLNQVLQQYSPDGDTSQFFYDRLGRLIVSQNKEQKDNPSYSGSAGRFSYTQYDALGRIKEVGEKSAPYTDIRNIDLLSDSRVKLWMITGVNQQITKTIYDNPLNLYQSSTTSRKRVVASIYLETQFDSQGDSTLYSYDILGNVKTLVQHIKALVAADATNGKKRIDYDYDLVSGKVNMVSYQEGKGDQFFYKYQYDADNRVTRSYSSRDKLIWTEDASYSYYLHGPLARAELGQYKVQGVDYAYTLQGWLKGINSDSLSAAFDMANDGLSGNPMFGRVSRDVYGFKLGYYTGDYTPIDVSNAKAFANKNYTAPTSPGNTGDSLFNGNISITTLALSKINAGATTGYSYGYDQLNRLVEMRQHTTGTTSGWSNTNIITAYRESIAYDANGNILQYLRNGTAATPDMDSLNYKYNRDGNGNLVNNKLDHVRDQVNSSYTMDIDDQAANNYTYDKIGNLKKDAAEHIDTIHWTVYGKIKKIDKTTGSDIIYGYDAGGNRTTKKVYGAADTLTYYVRDAQGNVLAVYTKKGSASLQWNEQDLYGSSRLGIWNWDTTVPAAPPVVLNGNPIYDSLTFGSRTYELTNHLGNVLSTISDKKIGHDSSGTVNYYIAEVLSQNDYYPFGMLQPGRKYSAGDGYRYGFNGKENDNEVKGEGNQQDYGMRIYDPRLGRFLSVDPIDYKYPELTPYQFASNTPLWAVDIDGLEAGIGMNLSTAEKAAEGMTRGWNDLKSWWNAPADRRIARAYEYSLGYPEGTIQTNGDVLAAMFAKYVESKSQPGSLEIPNTRRGASPKVSTQPQTPKARVAPKTESVKTAPTNIESVETVTVTRVQTQHKLSQRILVDESGNISIVGKTKLYITIDDKNHVSYYYNKKGGSEGGATIVSFQVKKEVADEIKKMAIPQAKAKTNPDKPEIADPTKSKSAYGLPANYIEKLQKGAIAGTGKVETP